MAVLTVNMGLTKWNEQDDPYDHVQLAGNFQILDEHDHTTGKGKRLSGASLEAEAVNTAQLADLSVTNAKLAGNISADKLGAGIVNSLGDLKWWWRPNVSTSIPGSGWVVAAGQTLASSQHDFAGGGTIVVPNLIGRTTFGVEIGSVGTPGGAASVNLNHVHGVNPHTHPVPAHSHPIALESGFNLATNLKISQDLSGSSWVHADNVSGAEHRHSINGNVGTQGPWTSGEGSSTTDSQLGTTSIIPPYVGLLPLLKVKNS